MKRLAGLTAALLALAGTTAAQQPTQTVLDQAASGIAVDLLDVDAVAPALGDLSASLGLLQLTSIANEGAAVDLSTVQAAGQEAAAIHRSAADGPATGSDSLDFGQAGIGGRIDLVAWAARLDPDGTATSSLDGLGGSVDLGVLGLGTGLGNQGALSMAGAEAAATRVQLALDGLGLDLGDLLPDLADLPLDVQLDLLAALGDGAPVLLAGLLDTLTQLLDVLGQVPDLAGLLDSATSNLLAQLADVPGVADARAALDAAVAEVGALQAAVDQAGIDAAAAQAVVDQAAAALDAAVAAADLTGLQDAVTAAEADQTAATADLAAATAAVGAATATLTGAQSDQADAQADVNAAQAVYDAATATVTSLQATIASLTAQIAALNPILDAVQIANLTAQLLAAQAGLPAALAAQAAALADLTAAQAVLASATAAVTAATTALTSAQADQAAAQATLDAATAAVADAVAALAAGAPAVGVAQDDLADAQAALASALAAVADAEAALAAADLDALTAALWAAIDDATAAATGALADLVTLVDQLTTQLAGVLVLLQGLLADLPALPDLDALLDTQLADLQILGLDGVTATIATLADAGGSSATVTCEGTPVVLGQAVPAVGCAGLADALAGLEVDLASVLAQLPIPTDVAASLQAFAAGAPVALPAVTPSVDAFTVDTASGPDGAGVERATARFTALSLDVPSLALDSTLAAATDGVMAQLDAIAAQVLAALASIDAAGLTGQVESVLAGLDVSALTATIEGLVAQLALLPIVGDLAPTTALRLVAGAVTAESVHGSSELTAAPNPPVAVTVPSGAPVGTDPTGDPTGAPTGDPTGAPTGAPGASLPATGGGAAVFGGLALLAAGLLGRRRLSS